MKDLIDIQPFDIPDYVYVRLEIPAKRGGSRELLRIPLADLNLKTLEELCSDFRRAVLEKAGKRHMV